MQEAAIQAISTQESKSLEPYHKLEDKTIPAFLEPTSLAEETNNV